LWNPGCDRGNDSIRVLAQWKRLDALSALANTRGCGAYFTGSIKIVREESAATSPALIRAETSDA